LHAKHWDGEFYPAEVILVSDSSKRAKAPVKVHFSGYDDEDDAWASLDDLKSKSLGLKGGASKSKGKAPLKADYSGIEKGMKLQCLFEGTYYSAEVVTVSKKRVDDPVKVRFVGYTAASDEWVGADSIRSKALKMLKPKAKAKAKRASKDGPKPIKAFCEVGPKGKPCGGGPEAEDETHGIITLTQIGDKCRIKYIIRGLKPGKHGFHIHDKADFSDGCTSAGPHYNPHGKTHGAPKDEERHVGDLGNIVPNDKGVARGILTDKLIKLDGEFSVVGRSFMVHADEDDLGLGDNSEPGPPPVNGKASKATGNAGARIACGEIKLVPPPIKAVCEVSPQGKACGGGEEAKEVCTGKISFFQVRDTCKIRYVIRGLTPGKHGFHIHDKADFSDGCNSAGPHYNPHKKTHGAPGDEERHVGDLGNVVANSKGVARGQIVDKLINLDGEFSVVGRSVMVHADEDDLGLGDNSEPGPPPVNGKASKATGNAGARIACGEIKLVEEQPATAE